MNENTIIKENETSVRYAAFAAVFGAVFTAVMFQTLFKFKPFGVNVLLTLIALYAVVFAAYKGKVDLKREQNAVLLPLEALFAAAFMIYNNALILFFDMIMLICIAGLQICLMTGKEFPRAFGSGFAKSVAVQLFARPFMKIGALFKSVFSGGNTKRKKIMGGILIGLAVCIPLTVILTLLLTSADMIFDEMVTRLISFETVGEIVLCVIMFSIVFMLTGSALICGAGEWNPDAAEEKKRARFSIPAVFIVVSVLSAILIVFGAVQVLYLARIKFMPYGFSYSEYARTGFFQLCGAAALVFAVLAVCMRFTHHAEKGARTGLNAAFTVLACSTLMLLISAFWRMALYEQEYLFTRLRLYTQAFMILLAVITAIITVKIWVRPMKLFKPIFYAVTVGMLALTYFNADGFIAEQAVAACEQTGKEPDFAYLTSLSADALPYYAEHITERMLFIYENAPDENGYEDAYADADMGRFSAYSDEVEQHNERARRMTRNLKYRLYEAVDYDDIRSFNVMRSRAANAFELPVLKELVSEE